MNWFFWLLTGSLLGFLVGAISAFQLAKNFIRQESRRIYSRWLRRERLRREEGLNQLIHDIRNPLFLIQTVVWRYRDRFVKEKDPSKAVGASPEKMYESVRVQTSKALGVLNGMKPQGASPTVPLGNWWQCFISKEHLKPLLKKTAVKTVFPENIEIPSQADILEEGLEDLFLTLLKDLSDGTLNVSVKEEAGKLRWEIIFLSQAPAAETFKLTQKALDIWTEKVNIIYQDHRPNGVSFTVKP